MRRLVLLVTVAVLMTTAAGAFAADRWVNYTSGKYVWAIACERERYVWCASSGGVARFDITTGQKIVYTRADGLADNEVHAIAIEADGNKWFGTDGGGVSVLHPDGSWATYNMANSGLADDDVWAVGIDTARNK